MHTPKVNYKLSLIVSLVLLAFGVGFGFMAFPGILRDIIKAVRYFCPFSCFFLFKICFFMPRKISQALFKIRPLDKFFDLPFSNRVLRLWSICYYVKL